ncbi:hypothetical protein MHUMG1_04420 [Metarhizium humberi]|uniref:Zn(2)-C6 fungal-type domain-containing protein n=1 Tax=Metarhizium humberi TaxID=2596975 RepID=A0A9P8MCT1_9HYPO|nr:hypothetical protein MHUMG1_04420 [Metarhizium humberi]
MLIGENPPAIHIHQSQAPCTATGARTSAIRLSPRQTSGVSGLLPGMELVNDQAAGAPTLKADVCRKHTLSCARKDEEKSLPEFRRGQKPRACESCYQSKVLCDKATPCSRCVSRGLTCRFRDVFDSGCSEQDAAYFKSESAGQAHTRVPVSNSVFLKGVVNPDTESMLEYFANDEAVNDKVPDLDYLPNLPDFSLPMMTMDGGNFAPWSFVSFLDDEFSDFSTSDETSTSSELSAAVPAFTLEGLERLRHVSDEIIRELGKSHKFLEEYDPTYTEMYHEDLAHSIFSSDNLARFISVFFRLKLVFGPQYLIGIKVDNWDEAQPIPVTSLKLSHLRAATMALSSMAVSAHLNGTMPATAPALLRAIDRWHDLWDAVTSKLDSASLQRSGMARHSNDISALIRKVVEVAISDTEQPAFLKSVGHESLRELYDFILNH